LVLLTRFGGTQVEIPLTLKFCKVLNAMSGSSPGFEVRQKEPVYPAGNI
jgi:hypothetical protein